MAGATVRSGAEAIRVRRSDEGVVTLTLDRPERLNATDYSTLCALTAAVESALADARTRVLVLTGSGEAFSTGADLVDALGAPPEQRPSPEAVMAAANQCVSALLGAPVPVIAAVNGAAAGVGVSLALASDLVLMADSAYLLFAFTSLGLMPDGGCSVLLPATVGRARAQRILLTGEKVDAQGALAEGLATAVHPRAELDQATAAVARRLARGPRRALQLSKEAVNASTLAQLDAALQRESTGQIELLGSADFDEGVQALLAGRRPEFS